MWLGSHAGCARLAVVYDKLWESRPGIMASPVGLGGGSWTGRNVWITGDREHTGGCAVAVFQHPGHICGRLAGVVRPDW